MLKIKRKDNAGIRHLHLRRRTWLPDGRVGHSELTTASFPGARGPVGHSETAGCGLPARAGRSRPEPAATSFSECVWEGDSVSPHLEGLLFSDGFSLPPFLLPLSLFPFLFHRQTLTFLDSFFTCGLWLPFFFSYHEVFKSVCLS